MKVERPLAAQDQKAHESRLIHNMREKEDEKMRHVVKGGKRTRTRASNHSRQSTKPQAYTSTVHKASRTVLALK
jgi:hypothetical protein